MEPWFRGYVRSSWTLRFICFALPLFINLRTGRTVESTNSKPSTSVLSKDCSSAVFMLSAVLLLSQWLETNIRFYEDSTETNGGAEIGAQNFETMMIGVAKILAHVLFCDLSMRLIWLPWQWFLYWMVRMNVLAKLVKTLLFFVKDFTLFSPLYLQLVAFSSSPKSFIFLRMFSAFIIFSAIACLFPPKPVSINSKTRTTEPSKEPPVEAATKDKTDPQQTSTTA